MTAVMSVATWHPRAGKTKDFLATVAKGKRIHERLGGKVRLLSSTFGGSPASFSYVVEHPTWESFGAFGEKLEKDNEWVTLWTDAQANPTADLVSNNVVTEVAI